MFKRVLVTGGGGFIGSHFIRLLIQEQKDVHVTCLDVVTYAAHPDTIEELKQLDKTRFQFVRADIADPKLVDLFKAQNFDLLVNFAAESHVDRSILDPGAFVRTNIVGVQNLADLCREFKVRFVQVSTDEVYGSLSPSDPKSTETSHLHPNSPYAASKAAADLLLLSYERTFRQSIVITRCTNNYGPYQFPEKLLPLVIANAFEDRDIPVYGDGKQVRDWIYVEDHCRAVWDVALRGRSGEVYNITANGEQENLTVIQSVLELLKKPATLMKHVGDRPAHDRRYALDSSKLEKELGWKPRVGFQEGIQRTVDWYAKHSDWWKKVRDKDYYSYYHSNYDTKFSGKEKPRSVHS